MNARIIIHYQVKLQTPFCYQGKTENVTFKLPEVTCRNCIEKKRKEQVNRDTDWKAIEQSVSIKLQKAASKVKEFCFAHSYQSSVSLVNFPPRIQIVFYIKARSDDKRRKTEGYNTSSGGEPNYIQVSIPTVDDLESIGGFVGELGESLGLRPLRVKDTGLIPLSYELRPIYQKH